jgi:hypothetical protein
MLCSSSCHFHLMSYHVMFMVCHVTIMSCHVGRKGARRICTIKEAAYDCVRTPRLTYTPTHTYAEDMYAQWRYLVAPWPHPGCTTSTSPRKLQVRACRCVYIFYMCRIHLVVLIFLTPSVNTVNGGSRTLRLLSFLG